MSEQDNRDEDDTGTGEAPFYRLRLYIAGASSVSARAVQNLNLFLQQELTGRYELDIIDIRQQPLLAVKENITALPVLVKHTPAPRKLLIGDMSDTVKVKRGLGLL